MTYPIQYSQPAYPAGPKPVRPPLTKRAKRGTVLAGSIGFVLLGIGWALAAIPVGIALFVGLFAFIVHAASSSSDTGRGLDGLSQFLDGINISAWILPLVLVSLLGFIVMAVAILVSGRILRSHRVNHPWGVTWAGTAIAVVASWIIGGIGSFVSQIVSTVVTSASASASASGSGSNDFWPGLWTFFGVSAVIALAVNAAIGWLAWWWMAHAMRPRA
ncbi:hypothetical protein [Glaciihabitans sp. UYNi722]|uniref:hypothetical protein n=1 Tax=Glaciihabitans sp. UYNi722 TaxID=3156344 RepID=UPI00339086C8